MLKILIIFIKEIQRRIVFEMALIYHCLVDACDYLRFAAGY